MKKNHLKKLPTIIFICFLLYILVISWVFLVGVKADRDGVFYNKGNNAIWIAHEWAEKEKSAEEIGELIAKLAYHRINTIYLHVGPLNSDGGILPHTYASTADFVEKVKMKKNDMKVLAWMGQLRHKIDLSDESVRKNILNMCVIFTKMIGMDGVHYDIEPVWDEDKDFIKLLEETRTVLDSGTGVVYGENVVDGENGDFSRQRKILSVALAEFIPESFVWWTEEIFDLKNYNTEKNYLNVARYADEIVDMVYDTGIDHDFLYRWLVKEQVIWLTNLMNKDFAKGTSLMIGIPAYEDVKEGFNPEVENVGNALLGLLSGLNDFRSNHGNFTGVAIYPEWEMDDMEWLIFDTLWNGKN